MKIAILGTRGIPNAYGGFEQFAEYISKRLVEKGHELYVYNSHTHPYQDNMWCGVNIIHCKDPENRIGTLGQFIYDLNCILDSRTRSFDVILQLGYTSSSIWNFLFKKPTRIFTNMDGLEWKRSKYNKLTQAFLKVAEKIAIRRSDLLISDSIGIQEYILNTYRKNSFYIPYGAEVFESPDSIILNEYKLEPYTYDLVLARFEKENNIEIILKAYHASQKKRKLILIGKPKNKFYYHLINTYSHEKVFFMDAVYNMKLLNNLRFYSYLYYHGHSVGGTNPSLLEAMASGAIICAHKNVFNQSILNEQSLYFENEDELTCHMNFFERNDFSNWITINQSKIKNTFNWELIANDYNKLFVK